MGIHPDAPRINARTSIADTLVIEASINARNEGSVDLRDIDSPFVSPGAVHLNKNTYGSDIWISFNFVGLEDSNRRIRVQIDLKDNSGETLASFEKIERDTRPEAGKVVRVSGGNNVYTWIGNFVRHEIPLDIAERVEKFSLAFSEMPRISGALSPESPGDRPDAPQINVRRSTADSLLIETAINKQNEESVDLRDIDSPFVSPGSVHLKKGKNRSRIRINFNFAGPEDSTRRISVQIDLKDSSGETLASFDQIERDTRPNAGKVVTRVSGAVKYYTFPGNSIRHTVSPEIAERVAKVVLAFLEIP